MWEWLKKILKIPKWNTYIRQEFKKIEKKQEEEEIKLIEKLINEDLEALVKRFIPGDGSIRTPEKAVFHEIDNDVIKNSLPNWSPKAIMDFISLLKTRYLDSGFADRLTEELEFLENLESGIKRWIKAKRTYQIT